MGKIKAGFPIPKDRVIEGVPVDPKEPTPEEKSQRWRKIDRGLKVIAIVLTILGGITFAEFIYEEALQQIGMSCFVLRSVGTADEIRDCGAHLREEGEKVQGFVEKIGWLNPLTYRAFHKFTKSTITQGQAYEKLGDYKDPQLPRPSLPYDSEDEEQEYKKPKAEAVTESDRLCNGTSCHLLNGWGK